MLSHIHSCQTIVPCHPCQISSNLQRHHLANAEKASLSSATSNSTRLPSAGTSSLKFMSSLLLPHSLLNRDGMGAKSHYATGSNPPRTSRSRMSFLSIFLRRKLKPETKMPKMILHNNKPFAAPTRGAPHYLDLFTGLYYQPKSGTSNTGKSSSCAIRLLNHLGVYTRHRFPIRSFVGQLKSVLGIAKAGLVHLPKTPKYLQNEFKLAQHQIVDEKHHFVFQHNLIAAVHPTTAALRHQSV